MQARDLLSDLWVRMCPGISKELFHGVRHRVKSDPGRTISSVDAQNMGCSLFEQQKSKHRRAHGVSEKALPAAPKMSCTLARLLLGIITRTMPEFT